MKTKITWFAVGFVASWLTWSVISYVRLRPQDLTTSWPSEIGGDLVPPWLRSAVVREVGGVVVHASSNEQTPSAVITPKSASRTQVIMTDGNVDGAMDSIIVSSCSSQSVSVNDDDGDGRFDWYSLSTDISGSNAVNFIDGNMDGQFDTRMVSGDRVDVWVEGQWRQRTSSNEKHYVELDSGTSEVVMEDRIWVLKQ